MCKEYLSTQKAFHEKELGCWILCTQSLFLQVLHTCHYDCKNAFERRSTQPLQQQSIPHVFIPHCTSLPKQVSVFTGSISIGFTWLKGQNESKTLATWFSYVFAS